MRRREYLRSTVGAAGLAGLAGSALTAAGSDDDASPSTHTTAATDATATATPQATDTDAGTATGDGFGPLAEIEVTNDEARFDSTEAVMEPSGRYAFVSRVDGFYVVDCADPENPDTVFTTDKVTTPDGRRLEQIYDLKYNQGRLLLATNDGTEFLGITLFDVRDPENPRQYRTYETTFGIHNADLHGEYAYLSNGTGVEIVDVAADEPKSVATWSVTDYDDAYADVPRGLRSLHDVYVQGGRAYLAHWDAGTWILDVSDPTSPSYVGHAVDYSAEELSGLSRAKAGEYFYEPKGNSHYVQPNDDGSLLAVGGESWNIEAQSIETAESDEEDIGGPSGVELWDIEDPANPTRLSTIEPPMPPEGETTRRRGGYWTTSHNFEIVGDYLYSSWYRGGVRVHDISDPENPEELAHWENGYEASFWTAQAGVPGEFFVATSLGNPTDPNGSGGFYTLPDPTGNAATVTPSGAEVDISTPTPTPTATPTATPEPTDSPTPSPTDVHTATPTDAPTDTATATPTDESTATATDASSGSGPGLGVLSGLAALGIGAWRLSDADEE